MNYAKREIYPNAPLTLVTLEVRLNYDPRANLSDVRDQFGLQIRDTFPVLSLNNVVNVEVQMPTGVTEQQVTSQILATDVEQSTLVSLSSTSLQLVMIGDAYQGYESFTPVLEKCVRTLESVLPGVGVERIGIRFLDEVRVPEFIDSSSGWSRWVNAGLLAGADAFAEGTALQLRGNSLFDIGDGSKVNFQWGDVFGKSVVSEELPLRKPKREESRFFVLDIDSGWEAPSYTVLSADEILARVDKLHEPLGSIFQWAITEDARQQFRGQEQ